MKNRKHDALPVTPMLHLIFFLFLCQWKNCCLDGRLSKLIIPSIKNHQSKISLYTLRLHIKFLICLILAILLSGCESFFYYKQAITGQVDILCKRKAISRLLEDRNTPDKLKKQLQLVMGIREFAIKELKLPADKHYLTYVELNRSSVAWNVFAAPEFSFQEKKWCYPIVGCVAYRGYFSQEDAQRYASKLTGEGLDVHVGAVSAYSTLGWFDDPIFSTFVHRSEARLAGLIFHELAHQILFTADDTTFNESFASAVEQEGLRRWFALSGKKKDYNAYLNSEQFYRWFAELVGRYREKLENLYKKDLPPETKRREKAVLLRQLKGEYEKGKTAWGQHKGYDAWFARPINNAKILSVGFYNDLVPAFLGFLQETGGDLGQFYEQCKILAGKPKEDRRQQLQLALETNGHQ